MGSLINGQFNFKLSEGPVMAKNCKAPGGLPQTLLGGFTVSPAALRDFQFVKIINALNGLCPSKVWDLPTVLFTLPKLFFGK